MRKTSMKTRSSKTLALAAFGTATLLIADVAAAQSLGGFPIREPGARAGGKAKAEKKDEKKGPQQIIVDANGPGPYKSINAAIEAVAEGGVVYVMHGVYNESITLKKSIFLQGDRGPGPGIRINAPMNEPCLSFQPKSPVSHAVVANVKFSAKINSGADACVNVKRGVFTLKESDVLGSGVRPAIKISGGTVTLEKNRIAAGSEGVFVEQSHSLSQSFIIDNHINRNKIGVDIASGSYSDVVIAGNEIFDNLDSGVKSSGYGGAKLIGNKIRNNKGAGVVLDKYSKLSLIRANDIIQNEGDGVAIPFGSNSIIEDNDIVGNSGLSIYVRDGLKPKVTNNFIENNSGDRNRRKKRRKRNRRDYD
ncbi:MAG: right-handed parallel beta-helix repeat-containing protein [Pseudomonadota bacterium]